MLRVTVVKSDIDLQKELVARHIVGLIKSLGLGDHILRILHQDS